MIATEVQEQAQFTGQIPARVSVVVPSFNHARFIKATLNSIINQTLPPDELLVIDDGSADDSVQVIESVLTECPFPSELVSRENRGLSATLNEGFQRTRGDYFAYLGSDDLWLPQFLRARMELLNERPGAVLAYGHSYLIDEDNRIVDCTAEWATYVDGDARLMLLQTTAPMSPTVMYRRAALELHRWDEDSKLEDYDLYLRLSTDGTFAFDERVLSAWRRHGSNVSWNQELMLTEQLKSQRAAALRWGYSQDDIDRLQRATRYRRAEDFLRVGNKSQALDLIRENWRGANSLMVSGKIFLRFLLPNSFMRGRRRYRERRTFERYGSL
jgi:alpha-1,3-rhamnosyltransferase